MIILAALALMQDFAEAPVLDPGASLQFKEAVHRTEAHLAAGEFEEAKAIADRLPKQTVTLKWDDSAVPAGRRSAFIAARDSALKRWNDSILRANVKLVDQNADIVVSFAEDLGKDPDNGLLRSAGFLVNYIPGEPVVEAVLALKRGEAQLSAESVDISNEVAYAIGLYHGLDRFPRQDSVMYRTEGSNSRETSLWPTDMRLCTSNIKAAEILRQAAAKKQRMKVSRPEAFIDVRELQGGTAMQGEPMTMTFQVTNRGQGPLLYKIVPDCSCFILRYDGEVAPGSTSLVRVDINTYDFPGPLDKSLYIYTNDPELPVRQIVAKGQVNHAYQFIRPGPMEVLLLGGETVKETVFLVMDDQSDIEVEDVSLAGVKGSVDAEPWTGMIADPATGQAARERRGYKLTMYLEPSQVLGRFPITVTARTNSQKFPRLTYTVFAQNGIAVAPTSLYLGEVAKQPSRAWFVLTRPGKPFKVLSLTSDSPNLKLTQEPVGNGDIKVVVEFDGKVPIGTYTATISVETNDERQPVIQVPVRAIVKE